MAEYTYTSDRNFYLSELKYGNQDKVTYTYDDAGNIQTRTEYAYTTGTLGTATDTVNYTYGDDDWGDLLTAYDGQSITYDGIGNPTSYYNGTRWNFTWEHGRELATASDGSSTWSYTYDAGGLRTKRTIFFIMNMEIRTESWYFHWVKEVKRDCESVCFWRDSFR